MGELAGRVNVVWAKTGSAITDGTGAKISGVDNSTYNQLCEILDTSQFGDTHRARIAGLKDTNLTVSGNYDPTDATGQGLFIPGDIVYVGVYPSGSAAVGLGQAAFIVENYEHGASVDGKQEFSCSLLGTAAPVALPAQT